MAVHLHGSGDAGARLRTEEKIAPSRSLPNQSSFQKVKSLAGSTGQHVVLMYSTCGAMRSLHSQLIGPSPARSLPPWRQGGQGQNSARHTRGISSSFSSRSTLKHRSYPVVRGAEPPLVCFATTAKEESKDDQPRQFALSAVLRSERMFAGTASAQLALLGMSCRRRRLFPNLQLTHINVARDHGTNAPIRQQT